MMTVDAPPGPAQGPAVFFGRRRPGIRPARILLGLLCVGLLLAGAFGLFGIRRPPALRVAGPLPRAGEFPHRLLEAALARSVTGSGLVDYARLRRHPHDLESYAAHLARVSPDTKPELFPTRDDSLAYWINAYNGLALLLALDHYPRTSLRTLDDPTGLLPGLVFLTRRFNLGGRWMSLHALEARALSFRDLRVHFLLNCASRGCPALLPRAVSPQRLDAELDEAVRRFLREARNFDLDPAARQLRLSALFSWHAAAFRRDLPRDLPLVRRVGHQALLSWIEPYLDDGPRSRIRSDGPWHVTFSAWDWSLNEAPPGSEMAPPDSSAAPPGPSRPEAPLPDR